MKKIKPRRDSLSELHEDAMDKITKLDICEPNLFNHPETYVYMMEKINELVIKFNTLNKTGGECECVLCNREPVEPPKPLEGCKNLGGASGSPGVIVGWEEKLEKILHPEESGFKPWWEVNRLVKDFIKADFIERKRVESVIKGIEDESGMDGILDDVKSRLEIGKHD